MGKKSIGRHGAKPVFRESDFAGRPPQEQAELSGALNHLSQQFAATLELLQAIEDRSMPSAVGKALPASLNKAADDIARDETT